MNCGAAACSAAIAACSASGPGSPPVCLTATKVAATSARPRLISARSQRDRSASASSTWPPSSSSRPGPRALLSRINASSAVNSGSLGTQRTKHPGEILRVIAQILVAELRAAAGGVPEGEGQVDHPTHGGQPGVDGLVVRQVERRTGLGQPALGPGDPGRHGRGGYQEGGGDRRRRDPAGQPQGQCDLVVGAQPRVATEHHEAEFVVADDRRLRHIVGAGHHPGPAAGLPHQGPPVGLSAPDAIDGPPASGGDQPGLDGVRDPRLRPGLKCEQECVGGGLLGDVQIADGPQCRGQDQARELTPRPGGRRGDRRGDPAGHVWALGTRSVTTNRARTHRGGFPVQSPSRRPPSSVISAHQPMSPPTSSRGWLTDPPALSAAAKVASRSATLT